MIHRYQPTIYYHTYGPNPPILKIKPGDTIIASTVDAGGYDNNGEQITAEMRQKSNETIYSSSNPLTGPFYVEDAEPGDTLNIKIKKIKLTRDSAWSRVASNFGGLTEEAPGRTLLYNDPIPSTPYEWKLNLKEMTGTTYLANSQRRTPEIPLHPFKDIRIPENKFRKGPERRYRKGHGGNRDFRLRRMDKA